MLSSSGYFSSIICPFFKNGFCERPQCQFKHEIVESPKPSTSKPVPTYVPTPVHKLKKLALESSNESSDKTSTSETKSLPEYKPTPLKELKKLKESVKRKSEDDSAEPIHINKKAKPDVEIVKEVAKSKSHRSSSESSSGLESPSLKTEKTSNVDAVTKSSKEKSLVKKSKSKSSSVPEIKSTTAGCDSSTIKKVRIAHQVNPSSTSLPKIRSKMSATEVMFNRFSSNSKGSPVVSSSSQLMKPASDNGLGKKRVAHTMKDSVKQDLEEKRPTMPKDHGRGGKVPLSSRQQYLKLFIDECLKICPSNSEAYERGLKEEKQVYDRSKTRPIYASLAANAVKKLRAEAALNSPITKLNKPVLGYQRVMSHEQMLNGPRTANCSIEKKQKSLTVDDLTESMLYSCLKKYVMKQDKLQEYGYPMLDTEKDGCAILPPVDFKTLNDFKTSMRICFRCKKQFTVNEKGVPIVKEACVFHFGRLWNEKSCGQIDRKYSCCKGDIQTGGCGSASSHVVDGNGHPDYRSGYVKTKPKKLTPESNPGVYALDCEMCNTTVGMELTRVSVIDSKYKTVYETLVKPTNKVLDYNTKFSGIKEGDLDGVKIKLEDVQKHLRRLFSEDTIIIGHSLESDLKALKLIHSTVVDTAEVFPHRRGLPFKRALRTVVAEVLKKIIQNEVGGHDSKEDAVSCLELMLWKVGQDLAKLKKKTGT